MITAFAQIFDGSHNMLGFSIIAGLAALLPSVFASPVTERSTALDTTYHCGQWDTITAGQYLIYIDGWGEASATTGSSCAAVKSLSGTTISWVTNWTFTGGSGVKSFTDVALNSGLNVKLSSISSIESTWSWSQSGASNEVADVAYDIFTSTTSGGSNANEIMVWLANYNAGPIASSYSSSGSPEPSVSGISLAGHTWNLYIGSNGSNEVYSFLPTSGTVAFFSGDLNAFLTYLTGKGYFSSSQYLTTLQAGTEATSGKATLTTSAYSVVVDS